MLSMQTPPIYGMMPLYSPKSTLGAFVSASDVQAQPSPAKDYLSAYFEHMDTYLDAMAGRGAFRGQSHMPESRQIALQGIVAMLATSASAVGAQMVRNQISGKPMPYGSYTPDQSSARQEEALFGPVSLIRQMELGLVLLLINDRSQMRQSAGYVHNALKQAPDYRASQALDVALGHLEQGRNREALERSGIRDGLPLAMAHVDNFDLFSQLLRPQR
jgi:hypothetical protein